MSPCCSCFAAFGRRATKPSNRSSKGQAWATPVFLDQSPGGVGCSGAGCSIQLSTAQGSPRLDVDNELRRPDVISRMRPELKSKFEVEQMVASPGTLPKPLSKAERERLIQTLLPTASHTSRAQVPEELLQRPTAESQALRLRLVQGATVVFFTAGYAGKRFVFERAAALGIKSVVIEHPDSWVRSLVDEGLVAKFVPVDMSRSSEEVFGDAVNCIAGLGNDGITGRADAICTFVELSVSLVARLCERFGLPGPTPHAVDTARDKHRTREALRVAGLPTPKNFLIGSEHDLTKAANHVGFPAVLKPTSGAASLGVKKVTALEELVACYNEVMTELRSFVVVSGALVQDNGSGNGVSADCIINLQVLLEQYLDGHEVDVDVVVSDGHWRYAAVTDNGPTVEPYFNETWGVCPSLLPLSKQRELKELAVSAVAAIGFDCGVFHVECKYTSSGPQLIEVNARMGGGPVYQHNLQTWGVDLVEESLLVALGIPARPPVPREPKVATAYFLVPAKASGSVAELPCTEELALEEGTIWAKPLVQVGERVTGPADGLPTWLLDIMVIRPTAQEAVDFVLTWEANHPVKVS